MTYAALVLSDGGCRTQTTRLHAGVLVQPYRRYKSSWKPARWGRKVRCKPCGVARRECVPGLGREMQLCQI